MAASSTLKTVAWAQEDFRDHDRDANGVKDFWRQDIAGLHRSLKEQADFPHKITEGDDRPTTALFDHAKFPPKPVDGRFWVRAIRFANETNLDRQRFAACCFPAAYGPGIRSHYIIREDGIVYRKDLGHGKGIDVYPADPLKEGWEAVRQ
jgi:hypothetical protein